MKSSLPHGKRIHRHRGIAMLYTVVVLSLLVGFAALAVDVGWLQLTKAQLQTAADAAARAAAVDLWKGTSVSTAIFMAKQNKAAGDPVILEPSDVRIGYWDVNAHTFTPNSYNPNAVEVTAARLSSRGTGVPLFFGSIFGLVNSDVVARATAMTLAPVRVNAEIPATGNIWLAGEPPGTTASLNNPHRNPDYAGDERNSRQSPLQIKNKSGRNFPMAAGQSINFGSIAGTARHDPYLPVDGPDGNTSDINYNTTVPQNTGELGKSNIRAPINSVIAVFLDDDIPSKNTSYPPVLDFSTAASRNFTVLKPKLGQVFFVGDGMTDSGVTQNFVVPQGATRLYMGMMDFFEWSNNFGSRTMQISHPAQSWLVK